MRYYNTNDNQMYSGSYLDRRGWLHPEIDLAALGFYQLKDNKPPFNSDYQQLVNERVEGDAVQGFRLVWDVEYLPLAKVKQVKQQELCSAYDAFLTAIQPEYTALERDTWAMQSAEAAKVMATPDIAPEEVPMLNAIAAARIDVTLQELAQRVLANEKTWVQVSGYITGMRHTFQEALDDAGTPEEVVAIIVDFSLPEVEEGA